MPLSDKTIKELAKRDARVLSKIQSRKTGIAFGKLAKATKLENNLLRSSTKRLCANKSIKLHGAGRSAFYMDANAKLPAPSGLVKAAKTAKRPAGKVVKKASAKATKRRSKAKKTK